MDSLVITQRLSIIFKLLNGACREAPWIHRVRITGAECGHRRGHDEQVVGGTSGGKGICLAVVVGTEAAGIN